jgi:predicted aspartyl protease
MLSLPIQLLIIDGDGVHLMVEAKAGRKKVRLIVDTGASKTVFDKSRFEKLFPDQNIKNSDALTTGLGTNSFPGATAKIASLKLGELKLKNFDVLVLDLSHVNTSYLFLGFKPFDGVLGSDLLLRYNAVIDFQASMLHFNITES